MPAPAARQQHKAIRRKGFIGFVLHPEAYSGPCSAATTRRRSRQARVPSKQMIYTCYEMVRDCRANLPEGWRHLIANYVPLIRTLVAHYAPGQAGARAQAKLIDRVLAGLHRPESS